MRELLVHNAPEYWRSQVRPLNFEDFKAMYERGNHRQIGFWRLVERDRSGEIIREMWVKNTILIVGAKLLLTNLFCATTTISGFKYIAISDGIGTTALTTGLTNGQTGITSLAVDALTATIANGTNLTIGAGTGQEQIVTLSAQANSGATNISVDGFTANADYAIGSPCSPAVDKTANPSSLPGTLSSYSSALANGDFTYSSDSTKGRVQFSAVFSLAGGASSGFYTAAHVTNTSPVSSTNQIAVQIAFPARQYLVGANTITIDVDESITPS